MDSGITAEAMNAPQSIAEVEQLVKRLYMPASPQLIQQINGQLQQLQLSQDGWKLADELMASDDSSVRFFAALTFTVKLNNDGPSLDPETSRTVLMRMISWLVRMVQKGEAGTVWKKMCSTLTTYVLRSPIKWNAPILHLALSFHHGDAITEDDVENSKVRLADVLPSLSVMQLQVLLYFTSTLAEEAGRVDANAQAHARVHAQMEEIVNDVGSLMKWSFAQSGQPISIPAREESLRTFLAWINYAQPNWRTPDLLRPLHDLIEPAAQCLLDEALFTEAVEVFREVLEVSSTFFSRAHMSMLATMIHNNIRPLLLEALAERDSDSLTCGQLVIAFGCANIQQVIEQPQDAYGSEAIVKLHLDMLATPGCPGDDDELSAQTIEFWNTYVEYANDIVFSRDQNETDPTWLPQAKATLTQALGLIWTKLCIPPHEVVRQWGDAEREGFREFRQDSTDLMLSAFHLLEKDIVQRLVAHTLQSLQEKQWRAVELGLFCLNILADNVMEDDQSEVIVGEVFRSSLFREIADFTQNIPSQTRRKAIDMLGSYSAYLEQHTEFLPDALRFLFASLETAAFVNTAAKSIASLCSTCRRSLTGELNDFLAQYQHFLASSTAESYSKVKVIGAIATIIQALPDDSAKSKPLLALLQNVEKDIAVATDCAAAGQHDVAELIGVTALECLASIGKGMQVPEDVPIDLDADDDHFKKPSPSSSYWASGEGQETQQHIVGCFSVLQIVGGSSSAVDATCQVLRSGYTETEPGPFVLPNSVTVSFVQQCSINTPQLDTVLSTACILIAQHSRVDSKRIDDDVGAIFKCVVGFAQALGQSGNDPTVAVGCIDIATRLLPYYTSVLLADQEQVSTILEFTLSALNGLDTLPKRSAAEFWAKLIQPQAATISADTQNRMGQVMTAYGPQFTTSIIRQIGGQAQRSDLDTLCEPLKALLLHQPGAQMWLQNGLTDDAFPSTNVAMIEREKFLRQLIGLRSDGRRIKSVVKVFWAACRGTVVSYSS